MAKQNVVDSIMSTVDGLQENGSGWTLRQINQMEVTYNKSVSLNANSYIPLPKSMKNKHAIVNAKNFYDEKCFLWAILSALHQTEKNNDRVMKYEPFENTLNMQNIEYPVSIDDIDIFETNNNPTISVNVYILDKQCDANTHKIKTMVVPIRLTENVREKHIHLLLLYDNMEFVNEDDDNNMSFDNENSEEDNNSNIDTDSSECETRSEVSISHDQTVFKFSNNSNGQMKKIFDTSSNINKL